MNVNQYNGNGARSHLQHTALQAQPSERSHLQHLRLENQGQHSILKRPPSPTFSRPRPPPFPLSNPHHQQQQPPPPVFQVGQIVDPISFSPASLALSRPLANPHEQKNSFPGQEHPKVRFQRSFSQHSLPDTLPANQSVRQARRTSQGPNPPRNVMMMGDSGGVALLRGPSILSNIQDPYAVQTVIHGGEVRRPSFSHLAKKSSFSSSRLPGPASSRRVSPLRTSSGTSGASGTACQIQQYPTAGLERNSLKASSSRTPSTTKPGKAPILQSSNNKQIASGSDAPDEEVWKFIMTSSAAAFSGGNDFGGSFSGSFDGSHGASRSGGQSNGMGGNENRGQGSGNSEERSNGDDNDGTGGGSPSSKEKERAAKKANPLVDLIETETAYVGELSKVIKKVAGAWSRSNFPPAELDTMFRNIESIYRVNRSFLKSLKEIGPNPSSPRALGDLLMRWIDDLETPYLRYCDNYFTDFDSWPLVQSNAKLPPLLEEISETSQADGSPINFSEKKRQSGQSWTLDELFALPQTRLRYYKKLYSRLLKSTQSGRSDHRLLVGANEKLDELLQRAKKRIAMSVLDEGPQAASSRKSSNADTSRTTRDSGNTPIASSTTSLSTDNIAIMSKDETSTRPPPILQMERSYSPLPVPSPSNLPSRSLSTTPDPPISNQTTPRDSQTPGFEDLEVRLDTSKTLDIFSLKPRKCQLRMNPPNIPFTRTLRKSDDVVIYFTPTTTGQEIVLRRAHIFLLTDLFLVCERKSSQERLERGGPSDMWLLYPPLAGKHLRVADNGSLGNSITVQILKKETLTIHLGSRESKVEWIDQFDQCNTFATSMGLKVKTSSDSESGPPNQANSSSLLSSRDVMANPSLSPAISVTPSRQFEEDENPIVKDTMRLIDEMTPFSPDDNNPLGRSGSFKSFVMPSGQKTSPQEDHGDRRFVNGAISPALASTFNRSPEPLSPSFPSDTVNGNYNRPPPPRLPSLPPGSNASFASPPMTSISPPTGPQRMQYQNGTPGMTFRPHPLPHQQQQQQRQGSLANGAPALPNLPPPAHLLNGSFANRPQPARPPPPVNQINGGGGPNHMGFARPPPPFRPPYGNNSGIPRPPEPSRMPSAPDLRARANQDLMRRASEENQSFVSGRARSASNVNSGPPKLPSDYLKQAGSRPTKDDFSPPSSPVMKKRGPKTSTVAAQMRCRLYLKQSHAQWKSLGNARIKVFHLLPDDVKQLVVENDKKPTPIISSIILPDGVERVGKVGVAIELSDNGNRTGIVYMVHLRSEESASALFGQLLEGSDRTVLGTERA